MKSESKSNNKFWNTHRLLLFLIILILVLAAVFLFVCHGDIFSSRQSFVNFINSFGIWSPLITIVLVLLEVIIAPVPGGLLPVATGFVFGPYLGTVYTWLGNVVGSIVVFSLARYFGKPLVEKIADPKKVDFYHDFISKKSYILWILYIIPLFPVDILGLVLGLTKIKFKKFSLVISICFIPNMIILNILGYKLVDIDFTNFSMITFYLTIIIISFLLIWGVKKYYSKDQKG